jgi:hypothetical protein
MTYHDIGPSLINETTKIASEAQIGMAWQDATWLRTLTSGDKDAALKAAPLFISHIATLNEEFRNGGYISDLVQTLRDARNVSNVSYPLVYSLEEKVAETLLRTVPAFTVLPQGANDYCENFVINLYGRMLGHDPNAVRQFVPKDVILQACISEYERILTLMFRDYQQVQKSWFAKMDAMARHLAAVATDKDQQMQLLQIGKQIMDWSRRATPQSA